MELDAEIFAVGKWNGMMFTVDDLQQLAATFDKLRENLRVGLKIGHTEDQTMANGQHALGWVDSVWVAGEKLMARFTDLPDVVHKAIAKKLYRNVSVEMDIDVSYKGSKYPYVLTGVALLGADIPAVNTLKDLAHYMNRDAVFSVGRRVVFSAIAGQSNNGGTIMDLEQLTSKVAALTVQVAALTTENAATLAENATLKASVAKFTADTKASEEAASKARITAKRAEVVAILEAGVKAEAITPAAREQFSKLMRIDDDIAVMVIDIEEVRKLTASKKFSRGEQGYQAASDSASVDQQVVQECNAILAKKEAGSFFEAQALLFSRNPKLAREYADFNDKE